MGTFYIFEEFLESGASNGLHFINMLSGRTGACGEGSCEIHGGFWIRMFHYHSRWMPYISPPKEQ
jgi:hypothetical protein